MSNFQMPCFDEGTINGRCVQFTEDWRKCLALKNGATWERCRSDNVEHPPHYCRGKIEVLDFIVDQRLNHPEGCVVKYVCRHTMKGGVEDLQKAREYLNYLIKHYDEIYTVEDQNIDGETMLTTSITVSPADDMTQDTHDESGWAMFQGWDTSTPYDITPGGSMWEYVYCSIPLPIKCLRAWFMSLCHHPIVWRLDPTNNRTISYHWFRPVQRSRLKARSGYIPWRQRAKG